MVFDVNPIWLAQSKMRRRRYDECIDICTAALRKNSLDQVSRLHLQPHICHVVRLAELLASWFDLQVAWYLKCRAITLKSWIDDTEVEEEVSTCRRCWFGPCCHQAVSLPLLSNETVDTRSDCLLLEDT